MTHLLNLSCKRRQHAACILIGTIESDNNNILNVYLANRHQVCATQVSSLQTCLFRTSRVQRFNFNLRMSDEIILILCRRYGGIVTWKPLNCCFRVAASSFCCIDAHTSVYTTSAPFTAYSAQVSALLAARALLAVEINSHPLKVHPGNRPAACATLTHAEQQHPTSYGKGDYIRNGHDDMWSMHTNACNAHFTFCFLTSSTLEQLCPISWGC